MDLFDTKESEPAAPEAPLAQIALPQQPDHQKFLQYPDPTVEISGMPLCFFTSTIALLERTLTPHSVGRCTQPVDTIGSILFRGQGNKHCPRQSMLNDDEGAGEGGEANPERPLGNLFVGDAAGCASRWGI